MTYEQSIKFMCRYIDEEIDKNDKKGKDKILLFLGNLVFKNYKKQIGGDE